MSASRKDCDGDVGSATAAAAAASHSIPLDNCNGPLTLNAASQCAVRNHKLTPPAAIVDASDGAGQAGMDFELVRRVAAAADGGGGERWCPCGSFSYCVQHLSNMSRHSIAALDGGHRRRDCHRRRLMTLPPQQRIGIH